MNKIYDCIIIGAGPAGVSAAIYLKRAGLDFLIFENQLVGGKVNLTSEIDNYPPFKNISGFDLSMQYRSSFSIYIKVAPLSFRLINS